MVGWKEGREGGGMRTWVPRPTATWKTERPGDGGGRAELGMSDGEGMVQEREGDAVRIALTAE